MGRSGFWRVALAVVAIFGVASAQPASPPAPTPAVSAAAPSVAPAPAPRPYQGKRIALIIANADYNRNGRIDADVGDRSTENPPDLRNALPDARLIAQTFRDIGFDEVRELSNLDQREMRAALRDWASAARTADVVALYYAGVGAEWQGRTMLMPVGMSAKTQRELIQQSIQMESIFEIVGDTPSIKLVLIDSARDDPFANVEKDEPSDARVNVWTLPRQRPADNMIIAYATSPGEAGMDDFPIQGGRSANGPFSTALARRLREPAVEIGTMIGRVTTDVRRLSRGEQNAVMFSSLPEGSFYLSPQRMALSEQPRLALVIGNGDYNGDRDYNDDRHSAPVLVDKFAPDLPNTINDARDIGAALTRLKFQVDQVENADKPALIQALIAFEQKLVEAGPDAIAVIYYSGHGIQVDGANFLVPVGARLRKVDFTRLTGAQAELVLRDYAVPVYDVLGRFRNPSEKGLNLIILDACRDNPWEVRTRAVGGSGAVRGLADINVQLDRTAVAFATRPGAYAADGGGNNSPYTTALKAWIERPGLKVPDLFNAVGNQVVQDTGGAQVPWFNTPPLGPTCIGPCPVVEAARQPLPSLPEPAARR